MQEHAKSRILIVDDDKANLDILNHILKSDYVVHVAKSGEMAIRRALYDQPDLILLDVLMPDMSGYEVLKVLKENEATKSIPVIFITALKNTADEERGFLLGAVDYVTKPFNHSIIKARIRIHMKSLKQIRLIEQFGTTDVLTEIPNARYFDERFFYEWEKAIYENKSLSILLINVDGLKQYNEIYGHLQGDVLLQTLAKTFFNYLHNDDDLVVRLGGDEFAFLLPERDLAAAKALADEICHDVAAMEIPSIGLLTTQTTVSIGIAALVPKSGDDPTILLEKANHELLRAKDAGGNQVCGLIAPHITKN